MYPYQLRYFEGGVSGPRENRFKPFQNQVALLRLALASFT